MKVPGYVLVTAILAVTALEIAALFCNKDGMLFSFVVGGILLLAGVSISELAHLVTRR
jgi:hypothetical protein